MFSFEGFLDLPLIWYGLIGTALFLYVLLDGFDLGAGHPLSLCPLGQMPGSHDELHRALLGRE